MSDINSVKNYNYSILVRKYEQIKNLKNGEKFVARNPNLYILLTLAMSDDVSLSCFAVNKMSQMMK